MLVNANTGIAVGMASSICPFNLAEVCETTIALMRDPESRHSPPPCWRRIFPAAASIVYDLQSMEKIYRDRTRQHPGARAVRLRQSRQLHRHHRDSAHHHGRGHCGKGGGSGQAAGKLKEISDIRDETGLDGLKITIDLKRGADPDKLMQRLFKLTPLEDSFSCNFNVLIAGVPRVLGVRELLQEWMAFRIECVRRRTSF